MTHSSESVVSEQLRSGGRLTPLRNLTKPGLQILVTRPVQFAAVAGGKQEGRSGGLMLVFQECGGFGRGKREWLAFLDAGHMMAQANEMEGEVRKHVQG